MISFITSTIQSVKQPENLVTAENLNADYNIPSIVATNNAKNGIVCGIMLPGHNSLMRVIRAALASTSEYQEGVIDLPYAANGHSYTIKGPITISKGALIGMWLNAEAMLTAVTARKDEANYSGIYHSKFTSDLFRTPFSIQMPHNEHYYRVLVDSETASGDEKALIANGVLLNDVVVDKLVIQACDQYTHYGPAPLTASPMEIHALLNYHDGEVTEMLWTHIEMTTPEVTKARVPHVSEYDDGVVNIALAKTNIMPIPIIMMINGMESEFDPYDPVLLQANSQLLVIPKPTWAPAVIPRPNNVDAAHIAMGVTLGKRVGWKIPTDTLWLLIPANAMIAMWNDAKDPEQTAEQLASGCAIDGWPLGLAPLADQEVSFLVVGQQPVEPPIDLQGFGVSSWAIDISAADTDLEFPIFWMR